jgi:hypothetical protein
MRLQQAPVRAVTSAVERQSEPLPVCMGDPGLPRNGTNVPLTALRAIRERVAGARARAAASEGGGGAV